MKKVIMLSAVLSLVFALHAAENVPLDPFSEVLTSSGTTTIPEDIADMKVAVPVGIEHNSFYNCLEILSPQERQNAQIEIMFMESVSKEVENYARSIEQAWNSGAFEHAFNMLGQLNAMQGVQGNAVIGITWRTPKPAPLSDWGDDVLISARDSVFVLAMDRDNATNNLFAMIGFTGDGQGSKYTANFSSNGGATWVETYALGGFAYVMQDLDACACGDFFWVSYTGGLSSAANSMCWLKRFQASDGQAVNMPNGSITHNLFSTTLPDTIMDLEITSNHDQYDNRLYVVAILKNGIVRAFWGYHDQVNWTEYSIGITNALQGLDANWNYNYDSVFVLVSYVNNSNQVELWGKAVNWHQFHSYGISNTYSYFTTSCCGWGDTLFYTFNYVGTYVQVRYLVQYGGGSWLYGFLAPDTTNNNYTPDVTLRNAGGTHGTYRGPSTSAAYYRYRGYSGTWSTPEQYNDHTASGNVRPEIENMSGGNYGILYRTPMDALGVCYFDRSDWATGVVEHKDDDTFGRYLSLAPNPTRDLTQFSFATQTQGRIRIALYDIAGRSVRNLIDETMDAGEHSVNIEGRNLPAGVYLVRIETPDGVGSRTMTIVR